MGADTYRAALAAAWGEIAERGHAPVAPVWRARAGLDAATELAVWRECLPSGMALDVFVAWARWLSEGVGDVAA